MYTLSLVGTGVASITSTQLLNVQAPLVSLCSVLKFGYLTARVYYVRLRSAIGIPGSLRHPLMM